MADHIHACIAYLVGRLITGKIIVAIYDYSQERYIDITTLPEADNLREFSIDDWGYMTGSSKVTTFQYSCRNGHSLELRISGNSFIGHLRETSAHFIGNIKGDTMYVYDRNESMHFSYRILGSSENQ